MADLIAIGYPDDTTAKAAAEAGAGLGALAGNFAKTSIDKQFQDQIRGMLQDARHGSRTAAR